MNEILSLCTGIGGLDLATASVYGGEVAAFAEIDPVAASVFSRHHPGVPNIGDIASADLRFLETDIITAGFPCQDISNAGLKKGIEGARSGIYVHVIRAVRDVRPRLVVLENVSAILRRGGDAVVGHLAALGYDARWLAVRASDACGACHPRDRWFCVAHLRDTPRLERDGAGGPGIEAQQGQAGDADQIAAAQDADPGRRVLLPTPLSSDGYHGGPNARHSDGSWKLPAIGHLIPDPETFGKYAQAVARHALDVSGRAAPNPHDIGPRGGKRVAAPFVEWMMGYPDGWVTADDSIRYTDALRLLGNAVMPQHATAALRMIEGG